MKLKTIFALLLVSLTNVFAELPVAGKAYITDTDGTALRRNPEGKLITIHKRDTIAVNDTVFETESESIALFTLSNSTGVYLEEKTRIEFREFAQERFNNGHTDLETEPSTSRTIGYIPYGSVALCVPKLYSTSYMEFVTPHVRILANKSKMTIRVTDDKTEVTILDGSASVQKSEFKRVINPGITGMFGKLEAQFRNTPSGLKQELLDKVLLPCQCKKTVIFEVKAQIDPVTQVQTQEIVAIATVPVDLPTEHTVSPAKIVSPEPTK